MQQGRLARAEMEIHGTGDKRTLLELSLRRYRAATVLLLVDRRGARCDSARQDSETAAAQDRRLRALSANLPGVVFQIQINPRTGRAFCLCQPGGGGVVRHGLRGKCCRTAPISLQSCMATICRPFSIRCAIAPAGWKNGCGMDVSSTAAVPCRAGSACRHCRIRMRTAAYCSTVWC